MIGQEVTYVQRMDVVAFEEKMYSFADQGCHSYEELGVEMHTFEGYVRAKIVPYIEAAQ